MAQRNTKINLGFNGAFKGLKEGAEAAKPSVESLATSVENVSEVNKKVAKQDPFKKMPDQAKRAKKEVDELKKSLQAIDKEISKIAQKALRINTGTGSTPGNLNEIRRINEANREANRLAVEREKLNRLQAQTQRSLSEAQQAAIRVTAQQEALDAARARRAEQDERRQRKQQEALRPYKELEKQFRDSQRAGQDLGAQLILLQRQGITSGEEFDRLSTQYNENQQQTQELSDAYRRLNHQLGNDTPNVGNYQSAFEGLENAGNNLLGVLGQIGIAVSGLEIGRYFIDTVKENEDAIAGFRTIVSDLNDTEFSKYENAINKVAEDTKKSTIDVANSFEKIAGLNAKFADTEEGLSAVSEAAITLSKASREELGQSAEDLVGIMNQFDLAADQADRTANVLAAGQAVGASTIKQSAEAYKNFGAVAAGANIELERSQGIIQTLAKNTIVGAEAGTKARGVVLQLQKANLGYASGQFDINDALIEYNKNLGTKKGAQAQDAYSTKIFGAENITAGKILAQNIDLINEFTEGVTGTEEAQKAAAINGDTLSNTWQELKNSLVNYITTNKNTDGVISKIKDTIKFLGQNIATIIPILTKLIAAFITYKAVMAGLDIRKKILEFIALRGATQNASQSLIDGTRSTEGFGKALKGLALTGAIALFFELGSSLYDVASGAAQAREDLARLEKQAEKSSTAASKNIDKILEENKKRTGDLSRELNQGKINQVEYNAELKKTNDLSIEQLNIRKESAAKKKEEYEKLLLEAKSLSHLTKMQEEGLELNPEQLDAYLKRLGNLQYKLKIKADLFLGVEATPLANSGDLQAQVAANLNAVGIRMEMYQKAINELAENNKDVNSNLIVSNRELTEEEKREREKRLKALADYTKRAEDIEDSRIEDDRKRQEQELQRKLDRELSDIEYSGKEAKRLEDDLRLKYNDDLKKIGDEFDKKRQEKRVTDYQKELEQLNNLHEIDLNSKEISLEDEQKFILAKIALAEKYGQSTIELAKELNTNVDAIIEERYERDIKAIEDTAKADELALLKSDSKGEEFSNKSTENKKKELKEKIHLQEIYGKDSMDLQIELAQLERTEAEATFEKEKKLQDERRKMYKEYADGVVDELKRISEKETERLDERIKNEQALQQQLIAAAEAGNISAQQSIAASRDAERKATVEKQREQRKQQALEEFKAFYNLVNTNLEKGDTAPAAVAKAFAQTGIIKAAAKLISAIPGFKKGTKGKIEDEMTANINTGSDPDNRLVRVAGSEMILNPNQVSKAEKQGLKTTDDIINAAVNSPIKYELVDHEAITHRLTNNSLRVKRTDVSMFPDIKPIMKGLQDVKSAIEDKTEIYISEVVKEGIAIGVSVAEKSKGLEKYGIYVAR